MAKEAGIRPIMITGDHQDTAEAIAKRLGIIDANDTEGHVLTGAELNELSDEDFEKSLVNTLFMPVCLQNTRFVSSRLGKTR